ncbi:MAG TPA: DnaJ domain-containing protein [Verrucomicrobiae bacterium]|jgi:curved DNA-binding protein CbpA|nr:DnaJ domain-containing protein [Verrucomicrobiae bacterium]
MAPPTDPYKLLQVDPEADPEIIDAAYRRLARRYHPDVSAGTEAAAMMVALNLARDILLDPARRAQLDRTRRGDARGPVGSVTAPGSAGGRYEEAGSAGPPPGNASGSRLDFGRYAGWSLGEVARSDIAYLEWLDRMSIGRRYRAEVDALLRRAGRRGGPARVDEPRGLFRRR